MTANAIATGIGTRRIDRPRMTPVRPTSEPTERSMPPVRMTKVMPIDTMPVTTDWSSRLSRLLVRRKYGESSDSATAMTIASASMRSSSGADRRLKRRRPGARVAVGSDFGTIALIGRPESSAHSVAWNRCWMT